MLASNKMFALLVITTGIEIGSIQSLSIAASRGPMEENSKQLFDTKMGILETTYLGSYNTRLYFSGNGKATQYEARSNCNAAGMQLVTFIGREDLQFVQSKLITNECMILFWTDSNNAGLNSCYLSEGRQVSNAFSIYDDYENGLLGLAFSKTGFSFEQMPVEQLLDYVCMAA